MSVEKGSEETFFAGRDGVPPPRRARVGSVLLARSPVFAVLAAAVAGWLLFTLWPEVAYFASSQAPIDLGAPGGYHLEAARPNRLVQVRGELLEAVSVSDVRSGAPRTVGRLAGTNLLVDRPGRAGPPVFEGRLLPAAEKDRYREVAAVLAGRGAPLGEGWQVLRDGDRPRRRFLPVLGAALVLAVLALNLRALLRPVLSRGREDS